MRSREILSFRENILHVSFRGEFLLNLKMRVYVKTLVYKNIAPHENLYSNFDDGEKMLKIS